MCVFGRTEQAAEVQAERLFATKDKWLGGDGTILAGLERRRHRTRSTEL